MHTLKRFLREEGEYSKPGLTRDEALIFAIILATVIPFGLVCGWFLS